jgi:outer membrane protein insertion porin family
LRTIFKNHGYLDVEINESDVIFHRRERVLDITIPVKPGQEYYVGEVSVSGNRLYSDGQIEEVITIAAGDVFSPVKV